MSYHITLLHKSSNMSLLRLTSKQNTSRHAKKHVCPPTQPAGQVYEFDPHVSTVLKNRKTVCQDCHEKSEFLHDSWQTTQKSHTERGSLNVMKTLFKESVEVRM